MQRLVVIDVAAWQAPGLSAATVCEHELHAVDVTTALTRLVKRGWADGGTDARDPRTAISTQVTMCTHATWVHPMGPDDALGRASQPAYMQPCLPFRVLQCLARLQIGAAQLEVQLGRQARPRVARPQRVCRLCSCDIASRPIWRARIHARTRTHDNVEDLNTFCWSALHMTTCVMHTQAFLS
jgi:hypothetical protein